MNKLIIDGQEYEMQECSINITLFKTPFLYYNGKNYFGKAIVKEIKKEKIFTTADGKDIYEGYGVWYVGENYNISKLIATIHLTKWTLSENEKFFSEKKFADDYVIENKPCLSYSEVLDASSAIYNNNYAELYIDKLKDLAKKKIENVK